MTLEQLAYLAELVGVILVIASLVYVAQQLRQNSDIMRAESRNQILHGHQQELFTLVQNPDIWKGISDEEMDDESVRLNMWLTASLRAREHEWFQYRHGALDKSAWESYSTAIPLALANERTRAWWSVMRPAYDKEFVETVDKLLANETLNALHKGQVSAISRSTRGL